MWRYYAVCLWQRDGGERHRPRWNEREYESNRDSYSLRSFTSGCCGLGDCDDIQATGMCIFIHAGDIHCGYRHMAHFPTQPSKLALFWIVCCKRHLTNKQRYEVVRVGGWERTLSSLFQHRDRAEQVVWGCALSLTVSKTASGPALLFWSGWELCCAEELE